MKKFKLRFTVILILVAALLTLTLTGCSLSAEDCYVFGEEEFESLFSEDNSLLDENAVSIMSANVLVHIKGWGGEPVKPRAHRFAKAIEHYAPDVIGVQEMCGDWYKYLLPQIEEDYQLIEPKNSIVMENRTPIIYNKNKLSLVESRLIKYSVGDKNGCRVITVGVFDRLSDGARFIVTSTHLDLIRLKDYDKEKETILRQVSEFIDTVESLRAEYADCPIFMTGDYNSMETEVSRYAGMDEGVEYSKERDLTYYKCYGKLCGSFAYEKLSEKYLDVKFADGVKRYYGNTKGYLYDDPTWDHIFLTDGDKADTLAFRVLSSDYFHSNSDGTSRISDHLPICADFSFNS